MISPENQLKTRTEIPKADLPDNPEKNERDAAIETLKTLGALVPVADLETYHGRVAGKDDESWRVDIDFSNGKDDSDHQNFHAISTLYAADERTAKEFADARLYLKLLGPCVDDIYDIASQGGNNQQRFESYMEELTKQNEHASQRYRKLPDSAPEYIEYLFKRIGRGIGYGESDVDTLIEKIEKAPAKDEVNVHEITSSFSDATVVDHNFRMYHLSDDEKRQYHEAMGKLLIPATVGAPVEFADRDRAKTVMDGLENRKNMQGYNKGFFDATDIKDVAAEMKTNGIDSDLTVQLAGALNAQGLVSSATMVELSESLVSGECNLGAGLRADNVGLCDSFFEKVPVNLEYFRSLFREAHIVGVKQYLLSGTIGKGVDTISFFDLESTITAREREARSKKHKRTFGRLAVNLSSMASEEKASETGLPLTELLHDPFAKPEALVDAVPLKDEYFKNAPSGTWEGYTIGQHTGTVLRNFDHNYADELPVALLPPMRLAILVHDMGKTFFKKASSQGVNIGPAGETLTQKDYNVSIAEKLLTNMGYPDRLKKLITALIGDGMELAHGVNLGKSKSEQDELHNFAEKTITDLYGATASKDKITTFRDMCIMLQTLDGGAYTDMATTRDEQRGIDYRNYPSFNYSFKPTSRNSTGRRIRQK